MANFILGLTIVIINTDFLEEPVLQAVKRFRRDMEMAFRSLGKVEQGSYGMIRFNHRRPPNGDFRTYISGRDELVIEVSDSLGIIYDSCYLGCKYLGILPLWFWSDQVVEKERAVCVIDSTYMSEPPPVEHRG